MEENKIKQLEEALSYAVQVIEAYASEIKYKGYDKDGFCQGTIFTEAVASIERIKINMKKYKVLFFGGGIMGELARGVLEGLDNVELTIAGKEGEVYKPAEHDLVFSASYPHKLPADIVNLSALGAVNIHTGLLPEGRGSNPLNWALIWGKDKTGITIHKITDTFDAGDICTQMDVPIFQSDNIVRLRERVEACFPMVIQNFFVRPDMLIRDARMQNQAHASYAQKRRPEDSELNLAATWEEIYNLFRSCDPVAYPAFVMRGGKKTIVKNVLPDNHTIVYEE